MSASGLARSREHPARVVVVGAAPVVTGLIRVACRPPERYDIAAVDDPRDASDADVLVVDVDGVQGAADLIGRASDTSRVVVCTEDADGPAVLAAMAGGASAYVVKPDGLRTIGSTIDRVLRGETVIDPIVARGARAELAATARRTRERARLLDATTPRQRQILGLLAEGMTVQQIASRLDISPRTVERHITALYRALGTSSRLHAVAKAATAGLIELG
jgi:DNA-binding NarL/FixJ family response regulator